jgi:UDP-N-acetylmuramoyl-tripeptide--D-alanyl-D-alanine ligase
VLVASDLSDVRRRPRERARDLADRASEAADAALFVGEHAEHAAKRALARGMAPENVAGVRDVRAAAAQLAALLRDGDLVLLKGRMTDHLSRILFAQLGSIECWATRCRKRTACDGCAKLRPGFDLAAALSAPPAAPGSR